MPPKLLPRRPTPHSTVADLRHLRVRAGEIKRIVQIASGVARERHAPSDAGGFVVPGNLEIAEPVRGFEDGSAEARFDVPFYVAVDYGGENS
jgi:hypothetical protein